jgi:hypothetical protein
VGHIPILLSKGIVAVPELVKFWKQKALDEIAATASASSSVTLDASVTTTTVAADKTKKTEDRFMAALANVDIPDPPSINPDSLLSPPRRERHGGLRSPAASASEEKKGSDRFKAALPPVAVVPPPPEGGVEPLLSPPRRERHGGARSPGKHSANPSTKSNGGESASPDQKKHKHADM